MGIEQLENKGFAFLNTDKINTEKRQIVVIGTARGGTSLVAGALHHLGIFTGDKSHPPVFEDVLLSEAFENNELDTAKDIVERYSNEHNIWAWKRPAALNYLDTVDKVIPNPFYIFIFKDIFAIANRNNISMQSDIGKSLQNALVDYSKIVDFVANTNKPVMLVSAEKALQNKESFVDAVIEMNKEIKDCSCNKDEAVEFITPNSVAYLDATRITKCAGSVDLLNRKNIRGWAKAVHHNRPIDIDLFVNGELYDSVVADKFRQDLKDKSIHPKGTCAFQFTISSLPENEVNIEVKARGDIQALKNGVKKI